jgi:class 3 adenylate cyclase/predicted ATPase
MDVVVWLRSLGLGKYEVLFHENDIDETVLPNLTAEDLKELGIAPLGHRRKLLDAIAALRGDASGKAPSADAATTSSAPSAYPEDRAERRQVTVMFSDLVGSTALSARMDPEDLREVISAYQKCVAETVGRFGGFVAKYMGDGVLIYFGYPQAHEDDAERAVRAGLELVAAASDLKTHAALQTRVGIATGLVVVGDLIGSGEAQERGIVGETPNLAARLQGIAEPNMVVIAEGTRRLLGNLFELEDLGAKDLKGIAGPVQAWAALRLSSAEGRFEAMHASGLTALVGREEELDLLLRRWSKAKSGEGQVVLLSGEPGIGKSRLTAALLERLATEPHTRLRYFCSPQRTDSALFPIISQMERAARFVHNDTVQVKLDKLDALLTQSSTTQQDAALLSEMLSLPNDGRYPALELTPQQVRQKTLEALHAQVETFARQSPVLMVFEDAHWSDPTSLEAFGRAVDRIATLPVLMLITFRPEFEPPWIGQPHVTSVTLNRLAQREVEGLIDSVAGNKPMPANILQEIIERTDGIPLFVEEMTKAVLEAESQHAAERMAAGIPSSAVAVPATLHASLMARLDRLGGSAKEVAQIGAAIGREFSYGLLTAVVRKSDEELQSALNRLVETGLLFSHGAPPDATYVFKHALVQDAAYGTLLREPRRALHARIAATLESQFAEIEENQPELLARHYTEAGLIAQAAAFWGRAGQRSLAQSALLEAVEQLTRALDQIASLESTPALRREQINAQVALANALMHTKGYAAAETQAALENARLLIEKAEKRGEPPEDPLILFSILYGFWGVSFQHFNREAVYNLAAQFLELAEKQRATGTMMVGHRLLGTSLAFAGDFIQGRAHYDHAIALYDPVEHRPLATRFGQDLSVVILTFRSWPVWCLGYPNSARADLESGIRRAREIGQAATLMYALAVAINANLYLGDSTAGNVYLDELAALAKEKGARLWQVQEKWARGAFLTITGNPSAAVGMLTTGVAAFRAIGATTWTLLCLPWLARAYAQLGRSDEASHCINEALALIEEGNQRSMEAECHRVAGELLLALAIPKQKKGEEHFVHALTVARQQQAKSWELRAAMSLARLWRDQGKVQQARELLAPVYGWFTEGFDTRDLKEAKVLLEKLAI